MNCRDIIMSRRSVRRYLDKEISEAEINNILESGIWAPSGLNNQPWKFKVIAEKNIKKKFESFTKYGHVIKSAAVLICVFLDKQQMYNRDKDLMAVGACIENMLLAAWEAGIGSCWLGEILNQKQEVCDYLKTDACLELAAVISLGYPDEEKPQGSRKKIKEFLL